MFVWVFDCCELWFEVSYFVFYAFDDKTIIEGCLGYFYGMFLFLFVREFCTLFVFDMNGALLLVEYGVFVWLWFEMQFGFKMVKWI